MSSGYFPSELPPVFTTADFGYHIDAIVQDWTNKNLIKKKTKFLDKRRGERDVKRRGSFTYSIAATESEVISKPKRGYERRNLNIVHPLPQALLSMEVSTNWKSLQKWLSRQQFSENKIRLGSKYIRSIKEINFPLHNAKKWYLEATADWVVTTDITRFYPSIYTHSIAWAAYGRNNVKRDLKVYQGSLADRIDFLVRHCNRNQTIGIPIGPTTSRIIAEIISSRIDQDYIETCVRDSFVLPKHASRMHERIDRMQDDWIVGVNSFEDAERVLSTISKVYRAYGLDINGSKTSINRILLQRPETWISELRGFLSHREGYLKGRRLREFIDLTLLLQSQNPSAPVVSYALSVMDRNMIVGNEIQKIESFLIRSAAIAPLALDRICKLMLRLHRRTRALSTKRIGKRFVQLLEVALEKGHDYEVIWLLFTLRGLKCPINTRSICEATENIQSATIPLLMLDMNSKGLVHWKLPIGVWQSQITKESIRTDWTWLLAYEGIRNGWLSDPHNLMNEPLFEPLNRRGITFYNSDASIRASIGRALKNILQGRRNFSETNNALKQLRGMRFTDAEY